jgi:chemotaxis regulatin CheY-phosphate phosphatase CheZ
VNAIFEACTFQDITGQRIRRAIEHLQHVESVLAEIIPPGSGQAAAGIEPVASDLMQDDVDRLFA